jgi:solute carrier family 25 S-adenosylmethionine transporter 26
LACTHASSSPAGTFFTVYEATKPAIAPYLPQPLVHGLASATAEAVCCIILAPAEVIKQNAQVASRSDRAPGAPSPTRLIARQFLARPASLWSGYGVLAARNLPFTALQFPVYERLKDALARANARRRGTRTDAIPLGEQALATAAAAGCSGALAAVLTTPVDVVKTRIMLAAARGAPRDDVLTKVGGAIVEGRVVDAVGVVKAEVKDVVSGAHGKPRASGVAIAREIVRTEGYKGLWRGGLLRSVWIFVGSGLYLGMYETGRVWLERQRSISDDDA